MTKIDACRRICFWIAPALRPSCWDANWASVLSATLTRYSATELSSEDGSGHYDVKITRPIKNGFAAKLSGIASKEAADNLAGTRLYAPRERLPGLPDDEFYHADLIGLSVLDTGGVTIGKIKAVLNHGAGDLLEISGPDITPPVLLPFTRESVPTVDVNAGRIIVDPPEGTF